ncbi:MAG: PQQ-binding-like beta-propeller repeat protein [Candidatus Brocadiae bacterium]|nr:PQQ-binding-like beta-propeller repeat protein [Candidatus Brocadiia bacterium]
MRLAHIVIVSVLAVTGAATAGAVKESGVDGGVLVRVGCGDPAALIDMKTPACIVHGLDTDRKAVLAARKAIVEKGLYGPVSADVFDGRALPYIADTVNLLVAGDGATVSRDEVLRVLAPGGVAYVDGTKVHKPVPKNTSDWGHFLYDASGNAVSPDTAVDVPFHIQWEGGPKWARSHDRLSSLNSLVSSDGKLFYIFDEGMTADFYYPTRWNLICRDAYNGIVLWKRDVGKWEDHWRAFRSGPNQLNRRVVSADDRLFASLGLGEPVQVIDAAAGKTICTLKGTEGAEEIIHKDGVLYLVALPFDGEPQDYQSMYRSRTRPGLQKTLMAVDPASGRILWKKTDKDTLGILPVTLIADADKVYFQSRNCIIALDKNSGKQKWKALRRSAESRPSNFSPALLVYKDVVISVDNLPTAKKGPKSPADTESVEQKNIIWSFSASATAIKGELVAFAAGTGKQLWTTDAMAAYGAQMDCFAVNDLVYVGQKARRHTADFTRAYDVHTGEIKNERDTASAFTRTHHHRCWRNKATCKYILMSRTGVELISFDGKLAMQNAFTRGNCEYGIMPANGLIYVPPHSCGCYIQVKMSGFFGLAPKSKSPLAGQTPQNVLVKGAAFNRVSLSEPATSDADWPTYRADARRSGGSKSTVAPTLTRAWKTKLAGNITSPVVAGDRVYVAVAEGRTLYALDRRNGKTVWTFQAGARIDSPPTVVGNTAYVGSRDGWVYALASDSGELAWKFRAAKSDRKHCAYGQFESPWPVHGSVLHLDGAICFAAGKSSYVDDGLYLYKLDAKTGKTLLEKRIYSRDPVTGDQHADAGHDLPGGLNDILATDGKTLFMRDFQLHLDAVPKAATIEGALPQQMKPHVHNTAGYLDATWAHRTYWYYGTKMRSGYGGWAAAGKRAFSGRLMVRDDDSLYAYGRKALNNDFRAAPALGYYGKRETHLYKAPVAAAGPAPARRKAKSDKKGRRGMAAPKLSYVWSNDCYLHVRAMALANDKVLVAGATDILRTGAMTREAIAKQAELLESSNEQYLRVYAKNDGSKLSEIKLEAKPVYDGMAVARGNVFISTEAGELHCFAPAK